MKRHFLMRPSKSDFLDIPQDSTCGLASRTLELVLETVIQEEIDRIFLALTKKQVGDYFRVHDVHDAILDIRNLFAELEHS